MATSNNRTISIALDPLATAAERCVAGLLDPEAPIEPPYAEPDSPRLIAWPGYINSWSDARAYYRDDAGVYRDTETAEEWKP